MGRRLRSTSSSIRRAQQFAGALSLLEAFKAGKHRNVKIGFTREGRVIGEQIKIASEHCSDRLDPPIRIRKYMKLLKIRQGSKGDPKKCAAPVALRHEVPRPLFGRR